MGSVFVTAAVVALVEFVKRIAVKDWVAAVTILGAAVIGGLAGVFHIDGLSVVNGIIAGLGAAGVYRISQVIGSTPLPS